MAIQYPVQKDSLWVIYSASKGVVISRSQPWPNGLGNPVVGADPDHIYLLQVDELVPQYNQDTQVLEQGEDIGLASNTLTTTYTVSYKPLQELKATAHNMRRARRTEAELAGFEFAGHPLDSDRDSILRIANAAASAISSILTQQPWATAWRCKDEHDLPIDAIGMLGLQAALAAHGQACHTTSTTIGAEIEAAETAEQVSAIIEAIEDDPRWPA
jgi:hypothetical protein